MIDIFAAVKAQAEQIKAKETKGNDWPDISAISSKPTAEPVEGLGLGLAPMAHQNVVIQAVKDGHRRLVVADEPGVGKTLAAIGSLEAVDAYPALIVCPPSLTLNWVREVQRAVPHRTVGTLTGRKVTAVPNVDVLVVPDSIIAYWAMRKDEKSGRNVGADLAQHPWKGFVVDEAHRMKGLADQHPAQRARACEIIARALADDAVSLALTGTPILNRPSELWGSLAIARVTDRIARTRAEYMHRYCDPQSNGFGVTYRGASNVKELHKMLTSRVMIRRLRADVLTLPNKGRMTVTVNLDQEARIAIRAAEKNLEQFMRERTGNDNYNLSDVAQAIVLLNVLRQVTGKGKVKSAVDMANDLLDEGEQVFVVGHHKAVIDGLVTGLIKHQPVVIDGSMNATQKQAAVDAFQSGKARVMVGNIDAAGVGFTLTAASNIIVVELPWTPGQLQQVEDRLHRIGQVNDVMSTIVLADGIDGKSSVDDRLWNLLNEKALVVNNIIDGKDADLGAKSIMDALLATYK